MTIELLDSERTDKRVKSLNAAKGNLLASLTPMNPTECLQKIRKYWGRIENILLMVHSWDRQQQPLWKGHGKPLGSFSTTSPVDKCFGYGKEQWNYSPWYLWKLTEAWQMKRIPKRVSGMHAGVWTLILRKEETVTRQHSWEIKTQYLAKLKSIEGWSE